ncbi:hypothetical protein GGR57DRAFT_160256 [Xylariaceae sp. FL1272]|nr:hypothetical protein GGR57DRAFT_160256 [Xylariaceae sp. FL1272]
MILKTGIRDADAIPLTQIPALGPPDGVESNFDNPHSRAQTGRIFVGLTYGLMVIFLTLRIYTRLWIAGSRKLGADDYLSLAAGATITAYTVLSYSLFDDPIGPHQWNVRLSDFDAGFLRRTLAAVVLVSVSSLFVKLALLVLYLRVFAPDIRTRWMIWVGIATVIVFYVIAIIINIRLCVPMSMSTPVPDPVQWKKKLEASTCSQPVYNLNAAIGVFGVISDLYILLIPVSMVLKLQIPKARKYGILGIFLTGLLATALSITSLVYRFAQLHSYDFTWDSVPSYTLRYDYGLLLLILSFESKSIFHSAAEVNIGVICSCLPIVFVVFKRTIRAWPWASTRKSTATPDPRTPSHLVYSDDIGRSNEVLGPTKSLTKPLGPSVSINLGTFGAQNGSQMLSRHERSTYAEVVSIASTDSDCGNRRIEAG